MGAVNDSSLASCVLATKQSSIFSSTPTYFRAWIYLTSFPGTPGNQAFVTAQSSTGATGMMGINSTGQYVSQVANSGGSDFTHTAQNTPVLPTSTWTCIELEIDTDYATYPNGLLAAWDDTSGTPDSQLAGTAKLQPLVSSSFGLSFAGPSLVTDLYVDDIAISTTYVPCSQ